jgi:hypothetical protein
MSARRLYSNSPASPRRQLALLALRSASVAGSA